MMAVVLPRAGASSSTVDWNSIKWGKIETLVCRLQMRIAKAVREGRRGRVKALQWLPILSSWVNRDWPY